GSACTASGGWRTAGAAAAGAAVGVVAASAASNAAASNAYANGYAAGTASGYAAASPTPPPYALGAIYATLPAGCAMPTVRGTTYYLCGNTWFQPPSGANGVYYRVVPAP